MRFGKTFAVPERHTLTRVPQPTSPVHKLVITGTGRTGTTFLVQILTELGLDTGYTQAKLSDDYFEHCSAGLERDMLAEDSPYVVKNPAFCQTLPALLATGRFAVDHVLVPIRDLDDAAQSRIRIGGQDGDVPGGLMGTSDPAAQKGVLAERFHRLMHTLAANDIPCTLLHFPRFVLDADYAWSKLRFLTPGLERGAFDEAFQRVAHPELIDVYKRQLIVGERSPPLVESPEVKRHVAPDEDAGERGHRALQEVAGRIGDRRGIGAGAALLGLDGSPGGHHADGGRVRVQVRQNAVQVPGIERVVLVEHHDPFAARRLQAAVPVADLSLIHI